MSEADKTTIRVRAFPDSTKSTAPQSNLTEAQNNALELVNKNALLEQERNKSIELLKTIEQLRESLKQEQTKTAEMARKSAAWETKANELAELEARGNKVTELEAKVKELTELLGKISSFAASGKPG